MNRLVTIINFIYLCSEFINIFTKGCFWCKGHLFLPFQWNLFLLELLINGLVMVNYMLYGPSFMTFIYGSIEYSYVPLKSPQHRTINHLLTLFLFTLFCSFQTNLRSLSTSLLSLFQYYSTTILSRCRYQILTDKIDPTLFCRCDFFDESWTCGYFFACSISVPINTKPYLWNYIEYNNELMHSYSIPHK